MIIIENVSLKPYNTFGIEATAAIFAEMHTLQDVQLFLNTDKYKGRPLLILGGGSNILFTHDVEGIVVKISTKGIMKITETDEHVFLNVQAGVDWNEFVDYCLNNDLGGVENLALIPGNVGSSPIQNIGAYGAEVKDVIESVEVVDMQTIQMYELTNKDCKFGYRNSIFKNELKGKVIIVSVTFKMNKIHKLNLDYGALKQELKDRKITKPTIQDVAKVVSDIRRCKLPDPKEIGNSGSFFKNPSLNNNDFTKLKSAFPGIPSYTQADNSFKIPAGWLIEQCGWKGYRDGDTGVHAQQALVLVNYGTATGKQVLALA
ncbi:MAG: UDP-N-acetylmuramate dehydrogenase, partial [Bacteroidales bacterium]